MENRNTSNLSPRSSQIKTACGGLISNPEGFQTAEYRAQRVYFCTLACLKKFEENPDPFMAGEIEHPIE